MTSQVQSKWAWLIATCAIAVALGCGDKKSSKDEDAGPDPFHNAGSDDDSSSGGSHSSSSSGGSSSHSGSGGSRANPGRGMDDDDAGSAPTTPSKPFDAGPLDASTDKTPNSDWIGVTVMRVEMADQSACKDAIERVDALDMAAQRLAADSNDRPMLKTRSMWQSVTAYELEDAMGILAPWINANVPACTWRSYGVGLVGAPGANHRLVLLLAE